MTSSRLGWPRTFAIGVAILFVVFALWAFILHLTQPQGGDFVSFWAAGRMTLLGNGAKAYDLAAHRAVELSVVGRTGILPFPYPPPFLLIVTPFALMPYPVSFVAWVVATALSYVLAARKVARPEYAIACPPVLVDFLIGQTGLFFGAIFIFGITLLPLNAFLGGALLGLMVMKPQLALMLPVALLGGRQWSAILGAAFSSGVAILMGLMLFGPGSYEGFLQMIPRYGHYLQEARWNWIELASPFAFARYFGIAGPTSLVFHLAIAAAAAAITWVAWSRNWKEKVPVVASATLLASPYLFTYDAVLMIVPAAYFIAQRQFWLVGFLWLLCALPVGHFFGLYDGPDTIPLATILAIGALAAPHLKSRELLIAQSVRAENALH